MDFKVLFEEVTLELRVKGSLGAADPEIAEREPCSRSKGQGDKSVSWTWEVMWLELSDRGRVV